MDRIDVASGIYDISHLLTRNMVSLLWSAGEEHRQPIIERLPRLTRVRTLGQTNQQLDYFAIDMLQGEFMPLYFTQQGLGSLNDKMVSLALVKTAIDANNFTRFLQRMALAQERRHRPEAQVMIFASQTAMLVPYDNLKGPERVIKLLELIGRSPFAMIDRLLREAERLTEAGT